MINFLYMLLVVGLAVGVYRQWWVFPIPTPVLNKSAQSPVTSNNSNVTSITPTIKPLRSKRSYNRIAQRPLFSATRRPPELIVEEAPPTPEVPKPPVEEQRLDGLTLTAVIMKGEERIALMKDPQTDKTLRLIKGETIRGWVVTEVGPGAISLLSPNGTSSDLNLRVFRPPIGLAATPPPVPPPPEVPPPEATGMPPGEIPPGKLPPQFNRRRNRRPRTL